MDSWQRNSWALDGMGLKVTLALQIVSSVAII